MEKYHPSPEYVLGRFEGYRTTNRMTEYARKNPDIFSTLVYPGYNELITLFNTLCCKENTSILFPKIDALKEKLGNLWLPQIQDLAGTHMITGIARARGRMKVGHAIRRGEIALTPESKAYAIFTAAMDTHPKAGIVGVMGHYISQASMAYLEDEGITDWKKDDILHAFDEVALLSHARAHRGRGEDVVLFPFFTNPNSLEEDGGLGWIKQHEVDAFLQKYTDLHTTNLVLEV